MAKKKPESTSDETTTSTEAPKAEALTQAEAVKRAIAAGKALPSEGVEYIKDTFGMELSKSSFSTVKNKIGRKETDTTRKGPSRPAGSTKAPVQASSPPAVIAPASTNGTTHLLATIDPAELARAVKQLVKQYGVESVKSMADVFAS